MTSLDRVPHTEPSEDPVGVVVMAYGTPASPDAVEAYYTDIRRGRPPTAEQLADLRARYDAIGGLSPLAARTEEQRAALAGALDSLAPGGFRVRLGQKHSAPFIEDAVADLAATCRRAVGIVLAPHYSRASVGEYAQRAFDAGIDLDLDVRTLRSWHLLPEYLGFTAHAVRSALQQVPDGSTVLFTAHSLPERTLDGDPYPQQLADGAAAVVARLGLAPDRWQIAWQSAGRTPEPWRGPDLVEVIAALGERGDVPGVVVCPHGFVSDHLEVLYDVDIAARGAAENAGLAFTRTAVLNDDPATFTALAAEVSRVANGAADRDADRPPVLPPL